MIPVVCIDNEGGMLFGGKRQSRDRVLIADVFSLAGEGKVYASDFSKVIFEGTDCIIDKEYLKKAGDNDYCFVEKDDLSKFDFDCIVVYHWNRDYPADKYLNVDLNQFKLESVYEFEGYSHDKITREVYRK